VADADPSSLATVYLFLLGNLLVFFVVVAFFHPKTCLFCCVFLLQEIVADDEFFYTFFLLILGIVVVTCFVMTQVVIFCFYEIFATLAWCFVVSSLFICNYFVLFFLEIKC